MAPPARAELPSKEVLSTVTTEVVPEISIAPPFPSASRDCENAEFLTIRLQEFTLIAPPDCPLNPEQLKNNPSKVELEPLDKKILSPFEEAP